MVLTYENRLADQYRTGAPCTILMVAQAYVLTIFAKKIIPLLKIKTNNLATMYISENQSLLAYNTFRLNVQSKRYAEYDSEAELKELLRRFAGERILPLGKGSNVLFVNDFEGVVLRSRMQKARTLAEKGASVDIEVDGGLELDSLIAQTVNMGLGGLENLSHIPGTVGACAVQNVGAYGVEIQDVIQKIYAMEISSRQVREFSVNECEYGYRQSIFKTKLRGRYIVTRVVFRLSFNWIAHLDYKGVRERIEGEPTLQKIRDAIITIRREKLPDVDKIGSAGSFFKNPIVSAERLTELREQWSDMPYYFVDSGHFKLSAAWLIEHCGLKGKQVGGARVYDKQPLVIINAHQASSGDIISLAEQIMTTVRAKTGIELSPEVEYVN